MHPPLPDSPILRAVNLIFYALDHFGVMKEAIMRQRKEHSGEELRGSGKPQEWPQLALCNRDPLVPHSLEPVPKVERIRKEVGAHRCIGFELF